MGHAPPYGFKFQRQTEVELRRRMRNATLPLRRHFSSCAVVGSSGTLLHAHLGAEIDNHEAVIRINGAPVARDYARFAGMKTTWRVMASPHAASDFKFKEERLFRNQTIVAVCDRPYIYSCQNILYSGVKPKMHGLNPIFYSQVRRHTGKSVIPLTGVVAVAVAMHSCDSVDVYGLSTMQSSKKSCYYYWSCGQTDDKYHRGRPGDAEYHDFLANAQALLRWNASGAITLRT